MMTARTMLAKSSSDRKLNVKPCFVPHFIDKMNALMAAYDDSSSSSDESVDEKKDLEVKETQNTQPCSNSSTTSILPSATDLFSGKIAAPKFLRRIDHTEVEVVKPVVGMKRKDTPAPLAPPQLKRPNISTEDSVSWNSARDQKRKEKKKRLATSEYISC
jgi:hypothetical protein